MENKKIPFYSNVTYDLIYDIAAKYLERKPFWKELAQYICVYPGVVVLYMHVTALSRMGFLEINKLENIEPDKIANFINCNPTMEELDEYLATL